MVVHPRGDLLTRVALPPNLIVRYIERDRLVGLWVQGPGDVEVRAYKLDRQGEAVEADVPEGCR